MTTSAITATRLKSGDLVLLPGEGDEIFRVKKIMTSAPGKHGHAKVRILYENIFTGSGGEVTYSGHTEIDKPVIEKERAQILSVTPGIKSQDPKISDISAVMQLMNLETFENYELPLPKTISEGDAQPGKEVEVRVYESKKWIERLMPTE